MCDVVLHGVSVFAFSCSVRLSFVILCPTSLSRVAPLQSCCLRGVTGNIKIRWSTSRGTLQLPRDTTNTCSYGQNALNDGTWVVYVLCYYMYHMYTRHSYTCVCIHMYMYIYIHMYVYTYLDMRACMSTNLGVRTKKRMYVYIYIQIHMHTHMHVCIHAYMHACTHTYICTRVHACILTYIHA